MTRAAHSAATHQHDPREFSSGRRKLGVAQGLVARLLALQDANSYFAIQSGP